MRIVESASRALVAIVSGCFLVFMVAVSARAAELAKDKGQSGLQPSANQGKSGKYHVDCKKKGYGYWVSVPASYGEANPAGLHLFFHGQHGQGGAEWFTQWDTYFLQKHNLIGINMQYMDGDNMADTDGKVAAAQEALAQTIADYKIIVGRGVICSFSGGGLPHGLLATKESKSRGPTWPFCHTALYSSNYRVDASQGAAMSWYIGVGTDEWNLAGANLGIDATHRTEELYAALKNGAPPDLHFKIIKGKGHQVLDEDVAESARAFPRSDLAFAPFVYAPDFNEPELKNIVAAANALQLGSASSALDKLASKAGITAPLKDKAEALKAKIDARTGAISALAKQLAADDPTLTAFYLPIYLAECKGTPIEKDLRALFATAGKDKSFQLSLRAHDEFVKLFPALLGGGGTSPTLVPDKAAPLADLVKALSPTSQTGHMAAEILALKN